MCGYVDVACACKHGANRSLKGYGASSCSRTPNKMQRVGVRCCCGLMKSLAAVASAALASADVKAQSNQI